ncbi:hypothetical protein LPJ72_005637, partial [Coemansia sp. Benny D160-2]
STRLLLPSSLSPTTMRLLLRSPSLSITLPLPSSLSTCIRLRLQRSQLNTRPLPSQTSSMQRLF